MSLPIDPPAPPAPPPQPTPDHRWTVNGWVLDERAAAMRKHIEGERAA